MKAFFQMEKTKEEWEILVPLMRKEFIRTTAW